MRRHGLGGYYALKNVCIDVKTIYLMMFSKTHPLSNVSIRCAVDMLDGMYGASIYNM